MRERPILFNGDMVRAILRGDKTQTRRPVRVRKPSDHLVFASPHASAICPFGIPGDRLWVRETWRAGIRDPEYLMDLVTGDNCDVHYRADGENGRWTLETIKNGTLQSAPAAPPPWRPSIHLPRWASRLTLEVVSVRAQRVQDITEEDAKAEGVERISDGYWMEYGPRARCVASARESFASLWRSIYGAASWEVNPWVWAVTFKRLEVEHG